MEYIKTKLFKFKFEKESNIIYDINTIIHLYGFVINRFMYIDCEYDSKNIQCYDFPKLVDHTIIFDVCLN